MKRWMGLALSLCFLLATACGAKGPASQAQPDDDSRPEPESQAEAPPPEPAEETAAFSAEDEAEFLRVLEESGFFFWAISIFPTNPALQFNVINHNGYSVPCMLVSIASWGAEEPPADGMVSADALKDASLALYGVERTSMSGYDEIDGRYGIPPHGPTHDAQLLKDTVATDGDTISVDILVSQVMFDDMGEPNTTTLRHTFTKNEEGAAFPYRLLSAVETATTYPVVFEGIAAPTNVYDCDVLGLVEVDELNMRAGPSTEDEKIMLLEKDTLLAFVGDDGGEWLCTYNGWVKAEYVKILGPVE